ncbi:Uncharacterised protein [Segatella copri]|nr:Uncharacterised protein [Segatella copri]
MEYFGLHIIHLLCFVQRDVDALLLLHHHLDGVNASGSFGGISIGCSHVDIKLFHRFLPCHSMIWHTVVQHAVHIKKHGFRVEFPKTVFFHIFKNNFLHQLFNVLCLMFSV